MGVEFYRCKFRRNSALRARMSRKKQSKGQREGAILKFKAARMLNLKAPHFAMKF